LANIPITTEEEEMYAEQLSKVISYIDQLNSVDIVGIKPTYNISENTNITRDDIESTSLTQQQALGNAANIKEGVFVTKGVFEEK